MSEDIAIDNNDQRPEATPESSQAFRGVYSRMMTMVAKKGVPIQITERNDATFSSFDASLKLSEDEQFAPNGKKRSFHLADTDEKPQLAWILMPDEDAAHSFGVIGHLSISRDGTGSHPADVYWLYQDQNIEHFLREMTYEDEVDEDGDPFPKEEVNTHLEWLNADQMHELTNRLEQAEAVFPPEDD